MGVIAFVAVAFLGYRGFGSALTYYYEVGELKAQGSPVYEKSLRVGGEVAPGIDREVDGSLRFTIIDIRDGSTTLPVVYRGTAVPDTFAEGRHVIVEGKYTSAGVFEASSILTQCPSKYIPEEAGIEK